MSIELERAKIEPLVRKALIENLAAWRANRKSEYAMLTEYIMEIMWEVAASTVKDGPEKGILAGVRMQRNWID